MVEEGDLDARKEEHVLWPQEAGGPPKWWRIVQRCESQASSKLDLGFQTIGPQGCQVLSQRALPCLPLLEQLYLRLCKIGVEGAETLAQGLQYVPELRCLGLFDNKLGNEGLHILVNKGLEHCPKLTELGLGKNGIGAAGAEALAEAGLAKCSELQELWLNDNALGPRGLEVLAVKGFVHCGRLKRLFLERSELDEEAARALARHGLRHCPELVGLYLGGNAIGNSGAEELADHGLRHCPKLSVLDLAGNGVGTRGAEALIRRGLPACPQLEELHLSPHRVGAEGAVRLAKALAEHPPQSLSFISGVALGAYVHTLGLPHDLSAEDNEAVLDALRRVKSVAASTARREARAHEEGDGEESNEPAKKKRRSEAPPS